MPRVDLSTGMEIDEACAIDDYILCSINPGNICVPWVGQCTMGLRVILWTVFVVFSSRIAWNLSKSTLSSQRNPLKLITGLALGSGVMRLVRDVLIVSVPYQHRYPVGTAFDLVWYLLPDVVVILSMCAIYTMEFFALTASQRMMELGARVLYVSNGVCVLLIIAGGVGVAFGQAIVFPLIFAVLGIVLVTLLFFMYYGNKVRKKLLLTGSESSLRAAREVSDFLQKQMKVSGICWLVYVITSFASIALSSTIVAYSSAICSTMQLIHRGLEFVLLSSWTHHVSHLVEKAKSAPSSQNSRAGSQVRDDRVVRSKVSIASRYTVLDRNDRDRLREPSASRAVTVLVPPVPQNDRVVVIEPLASDRPIIVVEPPADGQPIIALESSVSDDLDVIPLEPSVSRSDLDTALEPAQGRASILRSSESADSTS